MAEQYKRQPNIKCLICAKLIYRRPGEIKNNRGRVFCGQACYGVGCRKETPCVICGTPILASANKKTCSRGCANKHRAGIKYNVGRPKDKVKNQQSLKLSLLKTRGKKCERCGYQQYKILNVHHKDRDRNNNGLENLELICPNCYAEEHYLQSS